MIHSANPQSRSTVKIWLIVKCGIIYVSIDGRKDIMCEYSDHYQPGL